MWNSQVMDPPQMFPHTVDEELMHAIWTILLDDDFLHAYEHGIVILCPDGISRRFYPRICTYSADYPEK
jgi:Plavaka transposase